MIFCCEIHRIQKTEKKCWCQSFGWNSVFSLNFPEETKLFLDLSFCRPTVSRALVHKWHNRFSDGRISTKDNERVGKPTLIDEWALALVREFFDTARLLTFRNTADTCELKRTTVQCISKCIWCDGEFFKNRIENYKKKRLSFVSRRQKST